MPQQIMRERKITMIEEIRPYLKALKLRKIEQILESELKRAQSKKTSYSSFLLNLLKEEYEYRRQRAIENRMKQAGLSERWALETFPFHLQKGVNKKQIYELAELDFIRQTENIIMIGPTGVGKTGLSEAILLKAIYEGYSGRSIKARDLFDELGESLSDRSSRPLIKRLSRIDVLLIDELGYVELLAEQCNLFFRLIENRHLRKPTMITTNLGFREWAKFLGNIPLVSALLNRLLHKCHTIIINGPSLRVPKYKIPKEAYEHNEEGPPSKTKD